jgi:iron uptake system EfeUOB component EfeO/EfeM
MTFRAHRWLRPALITLGVALVVFFAVGALRGGSDAGSGASAANADTAKVAPVAAAQYSEQAPHVFSRLFLYPPQGKSRVTPRLPPDHPVVSAASFATPVAQYLAYSRNQLTALTGPLGMLKDALAAGDRAGARRAWAVAWAGYLRLGAVYLEGPVSALNDAIDGTPGGLPGGTSNPRFTGFHRIEWGLWTGQPTHSLVSAMTALQHNVAALRASLPETSISPLDYATRAHEILEDSVRDLLSGRAVPWSQQGVLGTAAGVVATREVLKTLAPVLTTSVSGTELDHLQGVLDALAAGHGGTLPTNRQLTQSQSEQLDAALGQTLEALAQVPGLLETAPAPAIPSIPRSAVKNDP